MENRAIDFEPPSRGIITGRRYRKVERADGETRGRAARDRNRDDEWVSVDKPEGTRRGRQMGVSQDI